jgi:type I restriction enzyme, S subunit
VISEYGVRVRDLSTGRAPAEDLSTYRVVRTGDLVVNKLWARFGGYGVSEVDGIISPAYWVLKIEGGGYIPRFLHYLLRSGPYRAEVWRRSKDQPPNGFELPWDQFRNIHVPVLDLVSQEAVVRFLDQETARIDALVATKRRLIELLDEHQISEVYAAVIGIHVPGLRQSAGVPWLEDVPSSWTVASVGARYNVQLGRMLNEERRLGPTPLPYLRNANVRWDDFDLTDVATMDFPEMDRSRYRLRVGDLLICEGGAGVGRAAIWRGQIPDCFYQKSLHRVRATSGWPVDWLLEWMRISTSMGAWMVEGNLATIPHLTAEQLRAYRMPFPPIEDCGRVLEALRSSRQVLSAQREILERQITLLTERRQSVVTSSVMGEMDILGMTA